MTLGNGSATYDTESDFPDDRRPVDTQVTFTCNPGYWRDGCEKTTCEMSGNWAHDKPKCNVGEAIHIILLFILILIS